MRVPRHTRRGGEEHARHFVKGCVHARVLIHWFPRLDSDFDFYLIFVQVFEFDEGLARLADAEEACEDDSDDGDDGDDGNEDVIA